MLNLKTWFLLIRSQISWKKFSAILAIDPKLEELTANPLPLLKKCGLGDEQMQFWRVPPMGLIEHDSQWLSQPNHYLVTFLDNDYPQLLKEIADPPLALFMVGDRTLLSTPQIAIVGTRNPTAAGREMARQFAQYLAEAGLTITSGLAFGVDAAAHQGVLTGSGKTIAVCGTGLDLVYPAKHRQLAEQISQQGALVSEFPLGTQPIKFNFPQRNRIISGLSVGTLVVEAALRSGSLITAHAAMEQGREVFAIPGSIHNPLSKGCHQLIRQGAKLVETTDDILEDLGSLIKISITDMNQQLEKDLRIPILDPEYQQLLDFIGHETISVDTLVVRSGLSIEVVASMLLMLELQSLIGRQPGGYIRI